jgi:hypothetical protein
VTARSWSRCNLCGRSCVRDTWHSSPMFAFLKSQPGIQRFPAFSATTGGSNSPFHGRIHRGGQRRCHSSRSRTSSRILQNSTMQIL